MYLVLQNSWNLLRLCILNSILHDSSEKYAINERIVSSQHEAKSRAVIARVNRVTFQFYSVIYYFNFKRLENLQPTYYELLNLV